MMDKNKFEPQSLNEDQVKQLYEISDKAFEFSCLIDRLCPINREKSLALIKLEEAIMWANSSIVKS